MKLTDVTLQMVKEVNEKHLRNHNPLHELYNDGKIKIVAFIERGYHEDYSMSWEDDEENGWTQAKDELKFYFSTKWDNFEIIVAEFWSYDKFDEDSINLINERFDNLQYMDFHNDANYSKYDVYRNDELI